MPREIERKFLVATDRWTTGVGMPQLFRQFYLDRRDRFSVRVRVIDGRQAFLTMKTGRGLSRGEYEYPIPVADADELEEVRIGLVIEKKRFRLDHGRHVIEVDRFEGVLAPLVVAEVEMESETDLFDLPDWFGAEITDNPAYSNAALALDGLPREFRS